MKPIHVTSIICSLIIGISIIIGCMLIPQEVNDQKAAVTSSEVIRSQPLMTIEQAAEYLGLSKEQVNYIIHSEQATLNTRGSFTGTMFPYFKINEDIYIGKEALLNWINDVTLEKRDYIQGQVLQ